MADVSADRKSITIVSLLIEQSVQLTVADDGTGLDASQVTRIFEPFVTTKSDGLGMGLAISRSIIESHRGRLWADAKSDGGASIHFRLPVSRGDP